MCATHDPAECPRQCQCCECEHDDAENRCADCGCEISDLKSLCSQCEQEARGVVAELKADAERDRRLMEEL